MCFLYDEIDYIFFECSIGSLIGDVVEYFEFFVEYGMNVGIDGVGSEEVIDGDWFGWGDAVASIFSL